MSLSCQNYSNHCPLCKFDTPGDRFRERIAHIIVYTWIQILWWRLYPVIPKQSWALFVFNVVFSRRSKKSGNGSTPTKPVLAPRRRRKLNHVLQIMGAFLWYDLDQDQWSEIIWMIHGRSNELMNPCPEWIHPFIWSTMIWVISDQWSWSRSSQRNTPNNYLKSSECAVVVSKHNSAILRVDG